MEENQTGSEVRSELKDKNLSPEEYARRLGELMRQCREESGFTQERVSISTKISLSFIQALESGDFANFPGSVFARGFIRNLCKIYQKDAKPFLEMYERAVGKEIESAEVAEDTVIAESTQERKDEASKKISWKETEAYRQLLAKWEKVKAALPLMQTQKKQLIIGASAGAIAVLSLTLFTIGGDDDKTLTENAVAPPVPSEMPSVAENAVPPAATEPAPDNSSAVAPSSTVDPVVAVESKSAPVVNEKVMPSAVEPAPAVAQQPAVAEKVATPKPEEEKAAVQKPDEKGPEKKQLEARVKEVPPAKDTPAVKEAPARASVDLKAEPQRAGKQTLELNAKNRVVVRLTRDGTAPQNLTLDARNHVFEFSREAQLLIFDASAVEIKYNGRNLGPLGKKGRVRRISFRRDDGELGKKM